MREGIGVVLISGGRLSPALWDELRALCDAHVFSGVAERVDSGAGNSLLGGAIERVHGLREMTFETRECIQGRLIRIIRGKWRLSLHCQGCHKQTAQHPHEGTGVM